MSKVGNSFPDWYMNRQMKNVWEYIAQNLVVNCDDPCGSLPTFLIYISNVY